MDKDKFKLFLHDFVALMNESQRKVSASALLMQESQDHLLAAFALLSEYIEKEGLGKGGWMKRSPKKELVGN